MNRLYRIGQIVPSSNVTMETEIPAMLRSRESVRPERFTAHASRMRMHRVVKEELAAMNAQGVRCAEELSDARVDVMSTACLVAHMAMGPGYHRVAQKELESVARKNGSNAAVMTSAGALVEGLKLLGAERIAMLMPYTDVLADAVATYIEAEGFEIVDRRNFCVSDNFEVGRLDPMRLIDEARSLDLKRAQVLVLSACVQMPSLQALLPAQRALGLPVTSTAACTVRGMLDRLGLDPVAPGGGAVLGDRDGL